MLVHSGALTFGSSPGLALGSLLGSWLLGWQLGLGLVDLVLEPVLVEHGPSMGTHTGCKWRNPGSSS